MGCGVKRDECEILAGAEAFLTVKLERANLGQDYQLLSFQSIYRAMSEFTRRFERVFVLIGAGGVLVALLRRISSSVSPPQLLQRSIWYTDFANIMEPGTNVNDLNLVRWATPLHGQCLWSRH